MVDKRVEKFADILVNYSMDVKKGEYVKINGTTEAKPLMLELYKAVLKKGAYPLWDIDFPESKYIYYKSASKEQISKFPQLMMDELKKVQVYFNIKSPANTKDLTNIDPKLISLRNKTINPVLDYIVNGRPNIRRCTTCYPTTALAQDAEMSIQEFEDFVFNSVIQDWKKLKKRFCYLRDQLNKGKKVRIVGEDTDIEMEIYNKSFIADCGEENMPGGEIFCAPVTKSVKGHIRFTYPAIKSGVEVTNIYAEFKDGKCIKAKADKNERFLNSMLDTDKGSRYIGELGIGMNPRVNRFTKELLFDEKKMFSIHLAFGMAYKKCGQPNDSAIHWDIVKDLKKGGEIILDGKVIQKNGKWLI